MEAATWWSKASWQRPCWRSQRQPTLRKSYTLRLQSQHQHPASATPTKIVTWAWLRGLSLYIWVWLWPAQASASLSRTLRSVTPSGQTVNAPWLVTGLSVIWLVSRETLCFYVSCGEEQAMLDLLPWEDRFLLNRATEGKLPTALGKCCFTTSSEICLLHSWTSRAHDRSIAARGLLTVGHDLNNLFYYGKIRNSRKW